MLSVSHYPLTLKKIQKYVLYIIFTFASHYVFQINSLPYYKALCNYVKVIWVKINNNNNNNNNNKKQMKLPKEVAAPREVPPWSCPQISMRKTLDGVHFALMFG